MSESLSGLRISDFVRRLPKTETHLHLEGALPLDLLREAQPEWHLPPPSWDADFKFSGFPHFLSELLAMQAVWFTSAERYHAAARRVFEQHLASNVRYVEVSFASGALDATNLDGREVLEAIVAAVPPGLEVRPFLGIHHDGRSSPRMAALLEEAITWNQLAGIDLHGSEDVPLEPWTADLWRAARRAGKYTKAHAGEFMGAEFVWRVLDELEPERIEHGVRAIEDPALLVELRRRGIALDMCPISNHKLMPGVSLSNHPIRAFYDSGVTVTLSTDNPLSFGNAVDDEYVALARHRGFRPLELIELAKNGFRVALLPRAVKERHIDELAQLQAQLAV